MATAVCLVYLVPGRVSKVTERESRSRTVGSGSEGDGVG